MNIARMGRPSRNKVTVEVLRYAMYEFEEATVRKAMADLIVIEASLLATVDGRATDYRKGASKDYNRDSALDATLIWQFLEEA